MIHPHVNHTLFIGAKVVIIDPKYRDYALTGVVANDLLGIGVKVALDVYNFLPTHIWYNTGFWYDRDAIRLNYEVT